VSFLDDGAIARVRALASEPLLAPGTLVAGKYRVEGVIGEGGMGVILAARHEELDRPVALKLLRDPRGGDDETRLLREARALSRLESEHVARVLDVGRLDDGAPYLVIERLEGKDLARALRDRGALPAAEAVDCVLQASEAVAEAHALGIVHRDLKPSNLFLTRRRDGSACVKVLDFGISKVEGAGDERSLTGPSAVIGSAWYMSPEQLRSSKHVDARTDVWALGVVLHELVAGTPPFDAETAAGVGARIAAGTPLRLRDVRPEAPAGLEAAILRCLEKDPAARFADLAELARAIAPFAATSGASAERIRRVLHADPPSPAPLPEPSPPSIEEATSSAWGAPRRAASRGALLVVPVVAIAALVAGALALRSPTTPTTTAPLPAAATSAPEPVPTALPTAAPDPLPTASTASAAPPRSAAARPSKPPHVAPPAKPRAAIDVRDPALDGR
jgi:serine/threonine protein kinase